jgi:hypothetical protein
MLYGTEVFIDFAVLRKTIKQKSFLIYNDSENLISDYVDGKILDKMRDKKNWQEKLFLKSFLQTLSSFYHKQLFFNYTEITCRKSTKKYNLLLSTPHF